MPKIKVTEKIFYNLYHEFTNHVFFKKFFPSPELHFSSKSFSLVYHYTSLTALISIIEDQCLWATNAFFLNDKSEFKHGVNIVKETLDSITNEESQNILKAIGTQIEEVFNAEKYVTCFSKKGDLLSQWKSYGNNGTGVSIGFFPHKLISSLLGSISGKDIIYDRKKQDNSIIAIINEAVEFFKPKLNEFEWQDGQYLKAVGAIVVQLLQNFITGYKDPAFEEEQEYRIEFDSNKNLKNSMDKNFKIFFRANEKLIIPYTKIYTKSKEHSNNKAQDNEAINQTITKLPIEEIIIGPSPNQDDIINGLQKLLKENLYLSVKIIKSKVPYRS